MAKKNQIPTPICMVKDCDVIVYPTHRERDNTERKPEIYSPVLNVNGILCSGDIVYFGQAN